MTIFNFICSKFPDVSPVIVARETFICVARLHASFWNNQDFSEAHWVRGHKWMRGEGAEEWEASMKWAKDGEFLCWDLSKKYPFLVRLRSMDAG